MAITFVRQAEPPKDGITRDFVGAVELLIVIEGTATFDDGTSKWLA